jgi:glycosyltransferase involved in cell wall biosynthesis
MAANLRRKREALARADAVIAVSSVLARDLAARSPELAGTRIETIPNPVDLGAVERAACTPHPLDGRPYAIYAGKLAANKGTSLLIPAIERADLKWPLVVIGDGPEREAVQAAAARSGRDVRLQGWLERDETLRWLAHCGIVVFPSYGPESLSRVLLESSALGRPIAAMDTGGTRDIIVDGTTGVLARTMPELAAAIARLVEQPDVARQLGARAAAFVRERFEAGHVVGRVEALYRELVMTANGSRQLHQTASHAATPGAGAHG